MAGGFLRAEGSRRTLVVYTLLSLLVALIVTVSSPLLLLAIGQIFQLDEQTWNRLSSIGQSFSGVSAVLAAIAIVGVIYTAATQTRQVEISQLQAVRTLHLELVKLAMDDAELSTIFSPDEQDNNNRTQWRQQAYTNLFMMFLQASWRAQEISDGGLRANLAILFNSPVVRAWWAGAESGFEAQFADDPVARRFVSFAKEEYRRSEPPTTD